LGQQSFLEFSSFGCQRKHPFDHYWIHEILPGLAGAAVWQKAQQAQQAQQA
jgi:hypothetical protein